MSYDERYPDPGRQLWELPLAILAAALAVALAAATVLLLDDRHRLAELRETQAPQIQQAAKLRDQLQSLGAETARLAESGNAAAKQVVDAMRQQGVTLKAGDK
jgi:hypothetical protein